MANLYEWLRVIRAGNQANWRRWSWWLGAVAAVLVVLIAVAYLAPYVLIGPEAAYVIGSSAVAAEALAVSWLAPQASPRSLWVVALPIASLLAIRAAAGSGLGSAVTVTAALLTAATLVGAAVGREIEKPGHLLLVAAVSAVADLLSLYSPQGITAAVAKSPAALSLLALPWPMLGTSRLEPLLGVGDVIFVSLYIAASRRNELSLKRTLFGLAGGFGMISALVLALQAPVPGLPILGAAIVLVHPQVRKLSAADARVGLVALGLMVLALIAVFWLR